MITIDDLNALNPWWTDDQWVPADDPHLGAAEVAPFTWDPRPFSATDLDTGAVFTLRGPRQSGKTTLTKRLIAERVAAGHARRCCFINLRIVDSADEIRTAIDLVLRLWPAEGPDDRWLFILDELTFVRGWANAIAHLREHNRQFGRATVILTGSSSADLIESADDLQGRRGRLAAPLDRLHMPMTFRDYLAARAPAVRLGETVPVEDLLTDAGRQAITTLALRTAELDQYLGEYSRCGGLPTPVTDMLAHRRLLPGTITELWRGLSADVRRLDRSEDRLAKLLTRTVLSLGSLTNLTTVMEEMDVAKTTAREYVDLLAGSFGLIVLHQEDPKRAGERSLTKQRKHYFGDTAFAAIPEALGGPSPKPQALVENLLAIALFRHIERNALEAFAAPRSLFLWRSSNDREIDFVADGGPRLPVECKYAEEPRGKDYESMSKAFGRGILASHHSLVTDREILTVPTAVLLAAIG